MKKRVIYTVLCALSTVLVQAQQVKLEYEEMIKSSSDVMRQYFEMQNVNHFRVTMKGDFNGKRVKIKKVTCNKGRFEELDLLDDAMHFVFVDSVETFDFMMLPYGKDSLRITCFYPARHNVAIFKDTISIVEMGILMETLASGDGPDIPILAYSAGIPSLEGCVIDFCGLRSSGVEAGKWFEKYGIDNYVFYAIRFEEDTPRNSGMYYSLFTKHRIDTIMVIDE
jgi:hypothetical protein